MQYGRDAQNCLINTLIAASERPDKWWGDTSSSDT